MKRVYALTQAANQALSHIYRKGYGYSKVGILLTNMVQADGCTPDMFAQPPRQSCGHFMETIDVLNKRFGKGAVRVGTVWPGGRPWEMRREMLRLRIRPLGGSYHAQVSLQKQHRAAYFRPIHVC